MSLADMIEEPRIRPLIATITGDPGVGKTWLAATFPRCFFIPTEIGVHDMPLEKRPKVGRLVETHRELDPIFWKTLKELAREDHEYKTLVIDTVTKLDQIFINSVLQQDMERRREEGEIDAMDPGTRPSLSNVFGGYGSGYQMVANMHYRVRQAAGYLADKKGMHVIFIAHSETETLDLPDSDPFTRYTLAMHKRSAKPYINDVSLIGFLRMKRAVMGFQSGERGRVKPGKAKSTGQRILTCYSNPTHVAKNRFGINKDLYVKEGKNPLAGLVPGLEEE